MERFGKIEIKREEKVHSEDKNKKGEIFHRSKKCGNNYKKISPENKEQI